MTGNKDARLYLRLNDTLKERMMKYAARHNTTVSDITTRFYEELLAQEEPSPKQDKFF